MKLLLITSLLILSACAHKTIHQICSEPDTAAKYKNYDQCYAEETSNQEQRIRRGAAMSAGFTNGLNSRPSTTCRSQSDGFGGTRTVCN